MCNTFQGGSCRINENSCISTDTKKVKKFPLAEFLGFIISAKKCVILDMSKAMESAKIVVYFQNYTLETS